MIHYTCDGCGVRLKEDTQRYVVTIEARRGDEAERDYGYEDYPDSDDKGEAWKADAQGSEAEGTRNIWRFDLCARCYELYMADPMAIVTLKRGLSRN